MEVANISALFQIAVHFIDLTILNHNDLCISAQNLHYETGMIQNIKIAYQAALRKALVP